MKGFRILSRNIRDSFKSVFRNFSLSLASISCITITLIVVAVSLILSFNVNNFTKIVEKDVTIVAFLDVNITEQEKDEVYDKLLTLDNVKKQNIKFRDKMDISKEMMASSEVFENIMKEWDEKESPIQDTYQIKVTDVKRIKKTAKEIKKIDHVAIVKYGEGMVEQLVAIFDVIRKASIGAVVALILVTAFLIANTIKITITSRRREIEIMRLVGASNINIKLSFIFEGLLLGVFGSIIPIIVLVYSYNWVYKNFHGKILTDIIDIISPSMVLFKTCLIVVAIGTVVGMIGSALSVRRHVKV